MKQLQIGSIGVGPSSKCLVIPEIGINHNGSLTVAIDMVDAAWRSGARLVKHQTHIVSDEMIPLARKRIPGNSDKSIYEIMEECSLTVDEEVKLFEHTRSRGLEYISTPFSRAAADFLYDLGVKAFKVGSGECNNLPLLRHIASYNLPIILSTGMNSLESVGKSVEILENSNIDYALLQCTNIYPTPYSHIHLRGITDLQQHFPQVPVGLSDHSLSIYPAIAAMGLGAKIVEKHFTDSKSRQGPDISCSMDATELAQLLSASDIVHDSLGEGKQVSDLEHVTIDFAFSSVVTIAPIYKGDPLTSENIWCKRPAGGDFTPDDYQSLLGKTVSCDLPADIQLQRKHLTPE